MLFTSKIVFTISIFEGVIKARVKTFDQRENGTLPIQTDHSTRRFHRRRLVARLLERIANAFGDRLRRIHDRTVPVENKEVILRH